MKLRLTRNRESWIRLGVGAVLNVCLWPSTQAQMLWGGYDREFHLALMGVLFAVPALVSVLPVFWRGEPAHVPIAFVLAVQPAFCVYGAVSLIIAHS
jgi:hypothetical protein